MASAYVPPPPEEDFLGIYTQQENTLNQEPFGQFGGDGFIGSTSSSTMAYSKNKVVEEIYPQRVPVAISQSPTMPQDCTFNFSYDASNKSSHSNTSGLRSVNDIPEQYRKVFNYTHFNMVQSKVFDDVMHTDHPLVTSAPTGSGKTVIFELAIVRLLVQLGGHLASAKIIYVAPIKALCAERFEDWQAKFGPLGLRCCELTGDSQLDDYFELQNAQIVMTTPEKWDSMTRKWRDHKSLVQLVRLFLIDEVHQLNDETRGPTMEAIVSRMKTIRSSLQWEGNASRASELRFIAVSATMPNISDVAAWLGSSEGVPALEYVIDERHRPVRLRKVVLGYPDASTEFKFDLSLNYRLSSVIQCYSDQKPSLVFCATRKGTQQAANILIKDARFVMNSQHKHRLVTVCSSLKDTKLRDLVLYGVGYHHAGMDVTDRRAVETLFTAGDLPVLFATSTLAMGVNLPAHLVVVKSTLHYVSGMFQECSESQVLQMIGRAGRPQFDTTATAVIMTRNSTKMKYEALLSGTQLIESSLHHHLIEHLNAEIVLHTITDVSVALEWLRSTFFYIRVRQNPQHYGLPQEEDKKEEKLQQLCLKHLRLLEEAGLVSMEDGFTLQPTETGRLMARYYVAFESMKRFLSLTGREDLSVLMDVLSKCREFQDVRLRMNERKVLNTLNKDKNRQTIRFPMTGKIKTTDMKVNCLIQASLGCLPVQEFALNQDTQKILRGATRLSKCLMELEMLSDNFECLLSSVLLHKCLQARLWENSKYVSRQLDKIGVSLSTALVNAGLTSFDKIKQKSPRELELFMNRHPPFGNQVQESISCLPSYSLSVDQSSVLHSSVCELTLRINLTNHDTLKERPAGATGHSIIFLIGDQDNKVICRQKLSGSQLMTTGSFTRRLSVQRSPSGDDLKVHVISTSLVGVDLQEVYTPRYSTPSAMRPLPRIGGQVTKMREQRTSSVREKGDTPTQTQRKTCSHRCTNKAVCGHECCKIGLSVKPPSSVTGSNGISPSRPPTNSAATVHSNFSRAKTTTIPITPRMKVSSATPTSSYSTPSSLTSRFGFTPKPSLSSTPYSISQAKQQSSLNHSYLKDQPQPSYNTSYSGSRSPKTTEHNKLLNFQGKYCDISSDFRTNSVAPDYNRGASTSVDMSEWFDPNIAAYFTITDKHSESSLPHKTNCEQNTSSRQSSVSQPQKKSAISKMRELSLALVEDQSMNQPTKKTLPSMLSGFSGRKRLIDSMFDEIFDPKELAQPLSKPTATTNTVPTTTTSQSSISTTQLAKKPRKESYSAQKCLGVEKSLQSMDSSLQEEKLSSQQVHNHTDDCNHIVFEDTSNKKEPVVSSLYDPLPENKPSSSTSFFTAGPVCNEDDEDDDLFSSVFAGIF